MYKVLLFKSRCHLCKGSISHITMGVAVSNNSELNKNNQATPPPPLKKFCGRVMRHQRIYSFRHVVLDLFVVSVCEHAQETR